MNLYLITFQSGLNKMESVYDCHKDLFVEIEKYFTLHLIHYKEVETIPEDAYKMAFIASGGVEKTVTQHFDLLPYPITLLTDGLQNSLAASLEIATWMRNKGMKARIIHGSPMHMVKQILSHHQAFAAKREIKGKRIGVIGYPSSWLVASNVDYLQNDVGGLSISISRWKKYIVYIIKLPMMISAIRHLYWSNKQ